MWLFYMAVFYRFTAPALISESHRRSCHCGTTNGKTSTGSEGNLWKSPAGTTVLSCAGVGTGVYQKGILL